MYPSGEVSLACAQAAAPMSSTTLESFYTASQNVTLTSATDRAAIHYTADNAAPASFDQIVRSGYTFGGWIDLPSLAVAAYGAVSASMPPRNPAS